MINWPDKVEVRFVCFCKAQVIVSKGKYMMIITNDVVDEGEVEEFDGDDGSDDDDDDANATSVWHIASSDVLGWHVGVVL
jgi:hypothetical protein